MQLTRTGLLNVGRAIDGLWIRLHLSLKNLMVVWHLCRQLLCLSLCLTVFRLFILAMIKGGEHIWFRRTRAPLMYCIVSAPTRCRLTIWTFSVLLCYTVPTIVRRLRRRIMRLLGPVLLPFLRGVLARAMAIVGLSSGSSLIGVDNALTAFRVCVVVAFLRRPARFVICDRRLAIRPRCRLIMVVCRVIMLPSVVSLSCRPALVVARVSVVKMNLVTLNIIVVSIVY